MPRCSNCSTVAAEGTHFCPRCGASMTAPTANTAPPSAPPPPTSAPPPYAPPPSAPPPYAPPPFQQPYPGVRPVQTTNGMAVASLVLGIVWLFWVGSILAVIFGYVGKSQIDRS